MRERIGKMHLIIPDCQIGPGTPTEHLTWIGNYIAKKRPDVIVQIGDFADLPSLNFHSRRLELEGKRYWKDIEASKKAMARLIKPWEKISGYNPKMVLTLGNHEQRIKSIVQDEPKFEGTVSMKDLQFEEFGWTVYPFLKVAKIDGWEYSHYFVSGAGGRPVTSAASLLRERQNSAVMGHVQYTDIAVHKKTGKMGIFCGICYLHNEGYLTPQGNTTRRQIVMLHEVKDGVGDPMLVSLQFLRNHYS